jgi:tripartite-type tricarboxylate transporter receptor subunit TctC
MRSRALVFLAAVATTLLMSAAGAQNYPNRPVRIIVPFGAGGIGDITTRLIAEKRGDSLGERFIVDNQPGAGGGPRSHAVFIMRSLIVRTGSQCEVAYR